MLPTNYRPLREAVLTAIGQVVTEIGPVLMLHGAIQHIGRTRKDSSDSTREIDVLALKIYVNVLREKLPGTKALVCSEENPVGDPISESLELPDLIFIVDPIDNTDGGIHGSPAYTALSVYDRSTKTVIAAGVGDVLRKEIYYADEDIGARKYLLTDSDETATPLKPSTRSGLPGAYISIYTLKPSRLAACCSARELLNVLGDDGRIDCIGGAASLCKVAAGYIDASVEFAKGFQAYDLFPGAYILMKAGGVCLTLGTGDPVSLELKFETQDELPGALKARQKFVGACTQGLFIKIFVTLSHDLTGQLK